MNRKISMVLKPLPPAPFKMKVSNRKKNKRLAMWPDSFFDWKCQGCGQTFNKRRADYHDLEDCMNNQRAAESMEAAGSGKVTNAANEAQQIPIPHNQNRKIEDR